MMNTVKEILDGITRALAEKKEVNDMDEAEMQTVEEKIDHLCYDTDSIIKMLSGDKMSESFDSGLLTGMMQKNGIDPGLIALLKDNDNWGGGSAWLILLFLFLMRGGAWGAADAVNDVAKESTLLSQSNHNALMDAISTQGTRQEVAVSNLAQSFGVSSTAIQSALANIDKCIAVTGGDLKSAIQYASADLGSKIQYMGADIGSKIGECCCKTNLNIERSTNEIEKQIAAQTNAMNLGMSAQNMLLQQQTQNILDRMSQYQIETNANFCAIRTREDARQIAELQQKLAEAQASANTNAILAAIANKDTVAVAGSLNTTAGTWSGTGSLS